MTRSKLMATAAVPKRHHLDGRASSIADIAKDRSDDELLSTRETAHWLGVSDQWLELGRAKNYGPKFLRISPRVVRYRRSDVRKWLDSRAFASIAEYTSREKAEA